MLSDSFYLASRYLIHHKLKTVILIAVITILVYLPAGLESLFRKSAEQLRARAVSTPLLVGSKGSEVDLALNSLYFSSKPPVTIPMQESFSIRETGFAEAIPLYVRYRASNYPIVGTSFDYFSFRNLDCRDGRVFAVLGECVIGSQVSETMELNVGDSLISDSENLFDIAGVYPLKMQIVGVLEPTGTPDDGAVFTDIKTTWVIEGLGHGHQDVTSQEAQDVVLEKKEGVVKTNAAVFNYNEITPENRESFHFHGEEEEFPLTAVIALPKDQKSETLLLGRYQAKEKSTQIIHPQQTIDELLQTVLRIRSFIMAGAILLGVATLLSLLLVFMLSIQIRQREILTMKKIGCSQLRIVVMIALEIGTVVLAGVICALCLSWVTQAYGEEAIRWFLLS